MKTIFYISAALTATSPLHIGSGLNAHTDSDILLDCENKPFIPATTLAGRIRHYFERLGEDVNDIFGYMRPNENEGAQSKIIFYDATLQNDASVANRDSVRIAQDGTAERGGKFDYELVEPGARFKFRAELICDNAGDAATLFRRMFAAFHNGDITLGAKTTRGFGAIGVSDASYLSIDLDTQIQHYIDFTWDQVTETFDFTSDESQLYESLTLAFDVDSFLFIRNYATLATDPDNKHKAIDAEQLMYRDPADATKGTPVIPGTSWAGIFRHHFERILQASGYPAVDELLYCVFGYVKGRKKAPSQIVFSESLIKNGDLHKRTRNAIDRFTGGAGEKKLFTTRPDYGGAGTLTISLPKAQHGAVPFLDEVKSLIDICVEDINAGLLTIGGEGSVGAGLLSMRKVGDWQ